jgi:hypothetical protein
MGNTDIKNMPLKKSKIIINLSLNKKKLFTTKKEKRKAA